jgi:hypothetical protein
MNGSTTRRATVVAWYGRPWKEEDAEEKRRRTEEAGGAIAAGGDEGEG